MIKTLINKLNFIIKKGFFHIFGSRVINRIVRFGSAIIVVRLLTKETFGSFSYAMNILEFFLLLNGLGAVAAILQFCSEKKAAEEKLPYLRYGLKIGISFNILIALSIIIFTSLFELPVKGSREILFYLALVPLFIVIFEIMGSYLRSDFKNREFSYLTVSNTLLYFLGTLTGAYLFKVYGIIGGRYLAFILTIIVGTKLLLSEIKKLTKTDYPIKSEKKEFLKFAVIASLTISISQILYLMDLFLIGLIIKKEVVVASYKTATLIPVALTFIPTSVLTFAYPYFAQNYKDKKKIKSYFYEMQTYLIILNFVISAVLIIFAPLIIKILFGTQYLDSVVPFRILCFGYFFAGSLRIPAGNVIASIRKVKINLYISIVSGILNILLDIILIYKYGVLGAAWATTSVLIISSAISNIYLFNHFRK